MSTFINVEFLKKKHRKSNIYLFKKVKGSNSSYCNHFEK